MSVAHPILARQLQRLGLSANAAPTSEQWRVFLEQMGSAYAHADQDRYTLERSIQLSSREMKQLHDDLRRSEQNLRIVVDRAPDAICVMSEEGGVVRYVNAALLQLLGYRDAGELLGRADAIVHPGDREKIREAVRQRQAGILVDSIDVRWLRRDGTAVVVEGHSTPIEFDGAPCRLVIGRDITARLRAAAEQEAAAAALRLSEERYRVLFDNCPAALVVFEPKTLRFVAANEAAIQLYGYTRDEFLSRTMGDLKLAEDMPEILQGMSAVSARSPIIPWRGLKRHLRKDGAIVDVEVMSLPVVLAGRPVMLAIMKDVTQTRRLEEQLRHAQKMDAVGQLAGGVAHDFNNLLAVVLSCAECAAEDLGPTHPVADELREISGAARRAAALTKKLLAFSRTEPREIKLLDLNGVILSAKSLLGRLIEERIRLTTELGPSLGRIEGDANHLEQILMNLVINARDAMPRGGDVTVKTAGADLDASAAAALGLQPGPYVTLTVSDTGSGMDAATRARVFEPFFTTKAVGAGTGLGLSTVFGIVRQAGGAITVESEPGHGTAFCVYFPSVTRALDSVRAPSQVPSARHGTGTVLLVEDDSQVRTVVEKVLRRRGYTVISTPGPDAALALLGHRSVDLVVTDLVMPGMDGRTMSALAEARHPGLKFLFMSGYSEHVAVKGTALGPLDHFLAKPFTPRELAHAVHAALGGEASPR